MPEEYSTHKNLEPVKECPYCGEEVFSRSLYGHVAYSVDDQHGGRGEVPEGFSPSEVPVSGEREFTIRVPQKKNFHQEATMCKFCREVFKGQHGLSIHLSRVKGDDDHPDDPDPETAGVRVQLPRGEGGPVRERAPVFRGLVQQLAGTSQPGTTESAVPTRELEALLDEFRRNEGNAGGWYGAAKKLEELIEEHQSQTQEESQSRSQSDQIPQ